MTTAVVAVHCGHTLLLTIYHLLLTDPFIYIKHKKKRARMNAEDDANDADFGSDDGPPGLPPPVPQFNPMDVALTYIGFDTPVVRARLRAEGLTTFPISDHSRKRTFVTLQSHSQSGLSMMADTSLAFGAHDSSSV